MKHSSNIKNIPTSQSDRCTKCSGDYSLSPSSLKNICTECAYNCQAKQFRQKSNHYDNNSLRYNRAFYRSHNNDPSVAVLAKKKFDCNSSCNMKIWPITAHHPYFNYSPRGSIEIEQNYPATYCRNKSNTSCCCQNSLRNNSVCNVNSRMNSFQCGNAGSVHKIMLGLPPDKCESKYITIRFLIDDLLDQGDITEQETVKKKLSKKISKEDRFKTSERIVTPKVSAGHSQITDTLTKNSSILSNGSKLSVKFSNPSKTNMDLTSGFVKDENEVRPSSSMQTGDRLSKRLSKSNENLSIKISSFATGKDNAFENLSQEFQSSQYDSKEKEADIKSSCKNSIANDTSKVSTAFETKSKSLNRPSSKAKSPVSESTFRNSVITKSENVTEECNEDSSKEKPDKKSKRDKKKNFQCILTFEVNVK